MKTSGGYRAVKVCAAWLAVMLTGCASSPQGANWALADFNKYDRNYAAFPTEKLRIGMPKGEALSLFGANAKSVSAEANGETYVVDKWLAVAGPDYVEERLFMRFERDKLANWKVDKGNVVTVAPRTF